MMHYVIAHSIVLHFHFISNALGEETRSNSSVHFEEQFKCAFQGATQVRVSRNNPTLTHGACETRICSPSHANSLSSHLLTLRIHTFSPKMHVCTHCGKKKTGKCEAFSKLLIYNSRCEKHAREISHWKCSRVLLQVLIGYFCKFSNNEL